jgi:hypothetical protein
MNKLHIKHDGDCFNLYTLINGRRDAWVCGSAKKYLKGKRSIVFSGKNPKKKGWIKITAAPNTQVVIKGEHLGCFSYETRVFLQRMLGISTESMETFSFYAKFE